MKWFIMEENRHSQTLKKYMEIYNIKPLEKIWIDSVFRSNATNSTLLKTICTQMLNDELKHVVLQSNTLHKISKNRNTIINSIIRTARKVLMGLTTFVVWHKYKKLFLKGNYSYRKFKKHNFEYLKESVYIEKNGAINFTP